MLDALAPLRHVYDVEPTGPPPTGGRAAEAEAIRGIRDVLDARPSFVPDEAVIGRVLARAAEASAQEEIPASSPVEAAVLSQSLQALDRLPTARPADHVIAAIEARAADAIASVAAVRAVYDGAPADSVEAAVLSQSRHAIDRAFAERPQPRPSTDAVQAILARAAEASGAEEIPAESAVEAAVLGQSLRALDRLPRPTPAAATLDAVRMAAATATAGAASATAPTPATGARPASVDRAAIQASSRSRFGVWAGASALVMAALVAVFILPTGGPVEDTAAVATVADLAPAVEEAPARVEEAEPDPTPAEPVTAPSASPLAASAGVSAYVPVPEPVRRAAQRPSPVVTAAPARVQPVRAEPAARTAEPAALAAAPPAASADAPAWDTDPTDVRALSLRLGELEDALASDAPSEAFGVPAISGSASPGIQSVRAGAAPARARLRAMPDSTQR